MKKEVGVVMFVSSYSTYISTNSSDKTDKQGSQTTKDFSKLTAKAQEIPDTQLFNSKIPIDYISKSKTFNNKLEVQLQQHQLQNLNTKEIAKTKNIVTEFSNYSSLKNAKQAYTDNAKIFSLFKMPQITLDQAPKIDKKAPVDVQEKNLRNLMVNTYIQNDKYYQLTA